MEYSEQIRRTVEGIELNKLCEKGDFEIFDVGFLWLMEDEILKAIGQESRNIVFNMSEYLFYAKVYLESKDKFHLENLKNYRRIPKPEEVDKLVKYGKLLNGEVSYSMGRDTNILKYPINSKNNISDEEVFLVKQTLLDISSGRLDGISFDDLIKAQKAILKSIKK